MDFRHSSELRHHAWLRTSGADVRHASIRRPSHMPPALDFAVPSAFCAVLFGIGLRNIRRKWIV